MIGDEKSEFEKGRTIGPFEILSFISRGGMGEVYLAHDRRLGRKVALKVLPLSFTKNQERLHRFEQEARSASALNHPNIITIYEILQTDSTHVIATEFVEGETLRQRLSHSQLTLTESLNIAIQVADALSAAHKVGIIHRDIKPENIMLRPDGYVKVLDFGLAKLAEQATPSGGTDAPTIQVRTGSGVVIGTAGYMSPEQARGQPVDARSDIFSLGTVIYEMLTRRQPFHGETPSDVLAAILKSEPERLATVLPQAPPELIRISNKALRKDREERYQVTKDLLLDLKSLKEELDFQSKLDRSPSEPDSFEAIGEPETKSPPAGSSSSSEIRTAVSTITHSLSSELRRHKAGALVGGLAIFLAVVGISVGVYKLVRRALSSAPARAVVLRSTQIVTPTGLEIPALSPDGNSLAYSNAGEIFVRPLTPGARDLQITNDGQGNFDPAWSPDGKLIAFASAKRRGIWITPATGGTIRQISEFGSAPAWSADGSTIAFQSEQGALPPNTIWKVSSHGGDPQPVTRMGVPNGGHSLPAWSPDGKRIAFDAYDGTGSLHLWTVGADGSDLKRVATDITTPLYSPDGQYLFGVSNFGGNFALYRLRISPTGDAIGQPEVIRDTGISYIQTRLSISADGKKMAYEARTIGGNLMSLQISAKSADAEGPPAALTQSTSYRKTLPSFSRDGKRIAFTEFLGGEQPRIWVMDNDGRNPIQLTDGSAIDWGPNWFPDNDTVSFQSDREREYRVWSVSVSTGRRKVISDPGQPIGWPRLSPDGKHLAFNSTKSGTINVWTQDLEGGAPRQLTFDNEMMGWPSWSPDGKLLALEIKRGADINVAIMPSRGGEITQLTFDHGESQSNDWSPDGDKILFSGQRNGIWNIYWISKSTKEEKQLTHYTTRNHYVRYPTWSPLGNQIVYEYAETAGNVWLLELK